MASNATEYKYSSDLLPLGPCRAKFDAMTELQRNRYEEYRRSTLPKARMKKVRPCGAVQSLGAASNDVTLHVQWCAATHMPNTGIPGQAKTRIFLISSSLIKGGPFTASQVVFLGSFICKVTGLVSESAWHGITSMERQWDRDILHAKANNVDT